MEEKHECANHECDSDRWIGQWIIADGTGISPLVGASLRQTSNVVHEPRPAQLIDLESTLERNARTRNTNDHKYG
jgi:hypothetical protein